MGVTMTCDRYTTRSGFDASLRAVSGRLYQRVGNGLRRLDEQTIRRHQRLSVTTTASADCFSGKGGGEGERGRATVSLYIRGRDGTLSPAAEKSGFREHDSLYLK